MESEPEGRKMKDADKDLNDPKGAGELAWTKCIEGCVIDENKEIISLSCLHSICSEECLAKMKAHSKVAGNGEALFCGICQGYVAPDDLKNRIVPSEVFLKKLTMEDLVLICENCVLELPAVAYCVDCPANLCEQCKKMHPVMKSTHLHNIEDCLENQKQKQAASLMKCVNHGDKIKTHYCFVCTEKICEKCIEKHTDHEICNMQEVMEEVEGYTETSRKLIEKFERADQDLEKKRDELLSDWKTVNAHIKMKSYLLLKSLLKRMNELNMEAKKHFQRKIAGLNAKFNGIKSAITMSNTILKTCDEIVGNRDELASINFTQHYKSLLNKFSELDKQIGQDYDLFVETDWHFDFETGFEGWDQIQYSYTAKGKPASPINTFFGVQKPANVGDSSKSSTSSNNATPSTSAGISLTDVKTEGTLNQQSGMLAVKSTGASQLSVSKLIANSVVSVLHTPSVVIYKGDGTDASRLEMTETVVVDKDQNQSVDLMLVSTSTTSRETSDMGRGKRQRKKKTWDDFISIDEAIDLIDKKFVND